METTLMFWDFFWIAIIVIVFGGGSAYVSKSSDNAKKLDVIIDKLDQLNKTDKPE